MKRYTDLTLEQYLDELTSEKPVPGGGSCAAYVASLGMGLVQMVGNVALKRKKKSGLSPEEEEEETKRRETIRKIIDATEKTKRDAFQIVNLDPEVYQAVMEAWGKAEKQEEALQNSFRLQADLVFLIIMARDWNAVLADHVSGSIKNDLLVSASLLEAAFRSAYHTALINAHYMKDTPQKERAEKALEELKNRFEKGNVRVGEGSKTP